MIILSSSVPNRQLPDLSIGEVVDVRRLEYLCRCHVLLAFMTRRNQPEHEVLLQKAYWFLTRLWQVCITAAKLMPDVSLV